MTQLPVIAYLSEFAQLCDCGHSADMHIDGDEQCFDVECGCKGFEEVCEFCGGDGKLRIVEKETGATVVTSKQCICQIEQ